MMAEACGTVRGRTHLLGRHRLRAPRARCPPMSVRFRRGVCSLVHGACRVVVAVVVLVMQQLRVVPDPLPAVVQPPDPPGNRPVPVRPGAGVGYQHPERPVTVPQDLRHRDAQDTRARDTRARQQLMAAGPPLAQRLHGLRTPRLSAPRRLLGHALTGMLLSAMAYGAWGLQPAAAYRLAVTAKPAAAMCPIEARQLLAQGGKPPSLHKQP